MFDCVNVLMCGSNSGLFVMYDDDILLWSFVGCVLGMVCVDEVVRWVMGCEGDDLVKILRWRCEVS